MNQERIGNFIAKLRKEKKLTQAELGEKLGVTNKTISRWETGKYMPDISLFKPLSETLGVSINDLMSGEIINKNDYLEKSNENILNTIEYTNKKIIKNSKIFKTIIAILITLIIILFIMYSIDIKKMNQNEPVLFSTWGYSYAPPIDLPEDKIHLAIREYLVEKGDSEIKNHTDEKTFVSMRVYLLEEINNHSLYYIYAWVMDSKYYLVNDELKQDGKSSIPYKFKVEKINEEYKVTDSRIPRDESFYSEDMKNIFPKSVRNDMNKIHTDGTLKRLETEIKEQAKLYYHK